MHCRYYQVQVHGQVITLLECPYCNTLLQIEHGSMKGHKAHLCPECEQWYVEPAAAHFKEVQDSKIYVLE